MRRRKKIIYFVGFLGINARGLRIESWGGKKRSDDSAERIAAFEELFFDDKHTLGVVRVIRGLEAKSADKS